MKAQKIIECVPNFSEGRDPLVIQAISECISRVSGVKLLHVDMGQSTNRTVITFAGSPEAVIDAAFEAIRMAAEKIDMRLHKGEHPRMGATDVCPLIPVHGLDLEETVLYAKKLGERVGKELGIPVYLYEAAASAGHRKNLANIRSGEYEGLEEKMKQDEWRPDYGTSEFNPKEGATVIGARDFLIAYNVNLNTTSVKLANEVAFDVRENGRPLKDDATGQLKRDAAGEIMRSNGMCPSVKAIGWYIQEYGSAQVSMNLTNMAQTALHEAFEACRTSAERHGLLVTGSELVGLVPKKALIDAGKFYLSRQKRSSGLGEQEIIAMAVRSLGLNSVSEFRPEERIIEYMLEEQKNPLAELNLQKFALETASENPAPGGGSVAAYAGTLGAALAAMVANLTAHKKAYESQLEFFSGVAEKAHSKLKELLFLVDEDTRAFNGIIEAFRLPKTGIEEKKARKKAIRMANKHAIEVPYKTMKVAYSCLELIRSMAEKGNPNSISDAGVGALCIQAAVQGAGLNVQINAMALDDEEKKQEYLHKANSLEEKTLKEVSSILVFIKNKISSPGT
ncbi:MAG: glutamate formimidoyltransferase [Saprospiraceae bacterium]|nr:glutamate formimidoyltransferase [Saprospiraceae bacterium]